MSTFASLPADSAHVAVVDAHTHIFGPEVVHDRERFIRRDRWFEHLYAHPKARLITASELLASMDAAGIAQSVVCGFPWRDPGICQAHNDYLAEACARSGGRLAWLATVSPLAGEQAAQEAERSFRLGARGIGELNADAQGFDFREPKALGPVVEACNAHDRPIMVHTTEPVGHAYPGKGTATPDRLMTFLEAYPGVRVVAAHWGGGLPFYELMPEVRDAAAHVVYDSAATTYLYRFDVFRIVLDLVGPERVMFASDFPILRQDRLLRRVQQIPWRDAREQALVLGETARKVYQIEPVSEQQQ